MASERPKDWEKKFLPRQELLNLPPASLRSFYPKMVGDIERSILRNPRPFTLKHIEQNNYHGLYAIWFARESRYWDLCLYVGKATENFVSDRLRSHCEGAKNSGLRKWVALKNGKLKFTTLNLNESEIPIPLPRGFTASDFISLFEDYLIWWLQTKTNRQRKWK